MLVVLGDSSNEDRAVGPLFKDELMAAAALVFDKINGEVMDCMRGKVRVKV